MVFFQNVIEDLEADPVINPFYYAQDKESWDMEIAAKAFEESQQKKTKERRMKKKKNSKSFNNSSFIIRKEPGHVRQLIKIIIHDLSGRHITDEIDTDPDSASVNLQYLVRSDYDDVMSETEHLVSKIVKKLSATS